MTSVAQPKRFSCDLCRKLFKCDFDLQTHTRTHTGVKPFICRACGGKFSTRATLQTHEETHETDRKVHECSLCDRTFLSRSGLFQHRKSHTGRGIYPCPLCDLNCVSLGNYRRHMKAHRGQKALTCQPFVSGFDSVDGLLRHASADGQSPKPLENEVTKTEAEGGDETGSTFGEPFQCQKETDLSVPRHDNLPRKDWLQATSVAEQGMTENFVKDTAFLSPADDSSVAAANMVTGELIRNAPLCVAPIYESAVVEGCQTTVVNTRNSPRLDDPEVEHECGFCRRTFSSKADLLTHLGTHASQNSTVPSQNTSNRKKDTEKGVRKKHKCSFCRKTFFLRIHLEVHEKQHAGEGKLQCPLCEQKFIDAGVLKSHLTLHTRENSFFDELRRSGLSFKSVLLKHLRVQESITSEVLKVVSPRRQDEHKLRSGNNVDSGNTEFGSQASASVEEKKDLDASQPDVASVKIEKPDRETDTEDELTEWILPDNLPLSEDSLHQFEVKSRPVEIKEDSHNSADVLYKNPTEIQRDLSFGDSILFNRLTGHS